MKRRVLYQDKTKSQWIMELHNQGKSKKDIVDFLVVNFKVTKQNATNNAAVTINKLKRTEKGTNVKPVEAKEEPSLSNLDVDTEKSKVSIEPVSPEDFEVK